MVHARLDASRAAYAGISRLFQFRRRTIGKQAVIGGYHKRHYRYPNGSLERRAFRRLSRDERISWASHRQTKEEEDQFYSLLGVFNVSMPLIYGEGKKKAYKRLQEEIEKIYKGRSYSAKHLRTELTEPEHDSDQFTISFDFLAIPEAAQFVGRKTELAEMRCLLHGHKSRSAVVLHGLGGIGKTQLTIVYIV